MKGLVKVWLWSVLGVLFGTAVGILRRKLPFGGATDAIFSGMIAAPLLVMFLLLTDYLRELVGWAIGGFIVGALFLAIVGNYAQETVEVVGVEANITMRRALNGGLVGAMVMTWFGAGWSIFRGKNNGIVGLLLSLILGAFCGLLVWFVGQSIGGQVQTIMFLGSPSSWRLGESAAGIPLGILGGVASTQYMFPQQTKQKKAF